MLGAVLGCLAGLGDEFTIGAVLRADSAESLPAPTPRQRRLAALGERLEMSDPGMAARLSGFVNGEAIRTGLDPGQLETADRVCSVLLEKTRVRAEFTQGLVQKLDGWVLARSEAGACVYLHRLIRSSARFA
jgi:hypothetical protein